MGILECDLSHNCCIYIHVGPRDSRVLGVTIVGIVSVVGAWTDEQAHSAFL
jgi:hypothetical protein